ncbi:MAG: hypothetical protein K940chlam5_00913 [Candidatus Anoxychlamydiales bacterium]|nr:hypothetical protein [Candidatus Anoxychlamydiales bacterium]
MITDYKDKKLVEYLEPGQKVLIRFGHGLGDTILFMPIFEKLKKLYPKVKFDLYVESGQEEIFTSIKDKDAPGYDHVFHLDFPMSEGSNKTKPQLCCEREIGIPPITQVAKFPAYESPFVAVHFQGTALPGSVSCPEEIAKRVWLEILEAGKIPIECHFQHCWHNPVNKKYDFIDSSTRSAKAEITSLIGLIQHSFAFIGIASGPFITALSTIPERTLYLEKAHPLNTYTDLKIKKVSMSSYKSGSVKNFLEALKAPSNIKSLQPISKREEDKHTWAINHFADGLKNKTLCKILWGSRSISKRDWVEIKRFLKEKEIKSVIEYGCGLSTELMLLEKVEVVSLENEAWLADICQKVCGNQILTYELGKMPEIDRVFDFAFMDGPQSGNREESIMHAKEHARFIYLHDLDPVRQTAITKHLEGWQEIPGFNKRFLSKP